MQHLPGRLGLILLVSISIPAIAQPVQKPSKGAASVVMHSGTSQMRALPSLKWHKGEINDAVYLKNGNLVTLSPDGDVKVWNSGTGQLIEVLAATTPRVRKLLPSPDGRSLMGFTKEGEIHQWELPMPKRSWGPEQMTGKPDSKLGDQRTAWASASEDGQEEWVLLEYATAVAPVAIHVYENENPGALIRAVGITKDGKEVTLWEGKDPVGMYQGFRVARLEITDAKPFQRIKLYLDSESVNGWNEIDAVGITDSSGTVHWATSAGASSTYAERTSRSGFVQQVSAVIPVPTYTIPEDAVAISHVDNTAEGKQSFGGSGHAIRFRRGADQTHIAAIEIFGSRYGQSRPPAEDFTVYILDKDQKLIKKLRFPYAVFQRGNEKWCTLSFEPLAVPAEFIVGVNFHAHQTKGVFLGKDTNVDKTHSFTGTPEKGYKAVTEKYDWMIRTHLVKKAAKF